MCNFVDMNIDQPNVIFKLFNKVQKRWTHFFSAFLIEGNKEANELAGVVIDLELCPGITNSTR